MSDSEVLRTVEQRVRSLLDARLGTLRQAYGAHLSATIGSGGALTGTELLSRPDLHTALTTALGGTQAAVTTVVRAGYRAAGNLARVSTVADLKALGFTPPAEAGDGADTPYLALVLSGLTVAFVTAALDIQDAVRAAFDGVTGTAAAVTAARILAAHEALDRAVRRLGVRISTAAAASVHRGYSDVQQALHSSVRDAHPYVRITKRWQVLSAKPCGFCAALDGEIVDLDEEFDRTAGPPDTPPLPVFQDLLGPPRHPNCRCRLAYEVAEAAAEVRAQVRTRPPVGTQRRLSAAAVRRMPGGQFAAITAFFGAAATKLRVLLRRARADG